MRNLRYRARWTVLLALFASGWALAQESMDRWVDEIGSLYYFAVLVEDVDRSVGWYRTVFGLRETVESEAEDESWRIVNLENDQLQVEIIRDDRAEDVDRAQGFFKVGFQVADVEEVATRVKQATGERPRIVDFADLKQRILQLEDPDGNTIQLFSRLEP